MRTARRIAGGMDPDELVEFVVWVERQGGHVIKWLPLICGVCYIIPADKATVRSLRTGTWDEQDIRVYALAQGVETSTPAPTWNLTAIQAPALWPRTQGRGIQVAVVDTGVDLANPDLPHILPGYNVINPQAPPQDDNGHGTHVAGIVGGTWADGSGVAPEADIVPVKVLDAFGAGSLSDVVDGLNWCLQQNIPIINLSLGAPQGTESMRAAILALAAAGVFIAAAAGNDGPRQNTVAYPAYWSETLAVGASTQNDRIANFSSRGPQVDVVAPGQAITSTWLGGTTRVLSGTSMAAPHVAGGAALLWSLVAAAGQGGKPADLQATLQETCRPLPGYTADAAGHGLIQLEHAAAQLSL
ncbi:MAG TPA: S8 family serine peptidase [Firmicutes bacterium]|jgi:subtilisin family serine protease|nr:S8 family serine peptidase [Bacillota bacterium]